jgi:hypothetical protein
VEGRLNVFLAFYFTWLVVVCTVSTIYAERSEGDARRFWPLYEAPKQS